MKCHLTTMLFAPCSFSLSQGQGQLMYLSTLILLVLHMQLLVAPALAYTPLSDDFLRLVPSGDADFDINNGKLLSPILIPRVAGTPGQTAAQAHFVNFFSKELPLWNMEFYNSTSTTPVTGDRELPFSNLLFKREPPWIQPGQSNLLTLVAHYDSKITPEGFIGATDSAAPCAILMHIARSIDALLSQRYEQMNAAGGGRSVRTDMGVQILLLDGEEAFATWTATDSLYGARALAEEWENTFHPVMAGYRDPLSQISMFVLLDLLGSADPKVPSYFQTTHWAYQAVATIEDRMRKLDLLESNPSKPFLPDLDKKSTQFIRSGVEDDHLPFMSRGVPILHMITSPFPRVWHTIMDDGEHLDLPTVRDWARIFTAFAMEWLDLMEVEPKGQGATS